MATSYKIRLKRFNGTDYDTLNLISDNIIMSSGNNLQTDYNNLKNSFDSFTVTLSSVSWSNNSQTINDVKFIANGYAYIVSPASASFLDYGTSQIYADDVNTDGQITFHCSDVPSENLLVNIVRTVST